MRGKLGSYGLGVNNGGDEVFSRFAMYVDGFHDGFNNLSGSGGPLPVLFGFREWLVLRDGGPTNMVWHGLIRWQANRALEQEPDERDLLHYAMDRLDEFLEVYESEPRHEIFEGYELFLDTKRQQHGDE